MNDHATTHAELVVEGDRHTVSLTVRGENAVVLACDLVDRTGRSMDALHPDEDPATPHAAPHGGTAIAWDNNDGAGQFDPTSTEEGGSE